MRDHRDLHMQEYDELLKRPEWKKFSDAVKERDGHACQSCGRSGVLHAHHRQYHLIEESGQFQLPWNYPKKALITLCEECHNLGHQKFKVPVIKI